MASTTVEYPPAAAREQASAGTRRDEDRAVSGGKNREITVCAWHDGGIEAIHLRRGSTGRLHCSLAKGAGAARGRWRLGASPRPCAVILPRNKYLVRSVELPRAGEEETQEMVGLEMEAWLPPEWGECEVSYRQLARRESSMHLEVYVVRRSDAEECLARVRAAGYWPTLIVPSALLWALMPLAWESTGLLVIPQGGDGYEVVGRGANGAVQSRVISAPVSGIADRLSACARSMAPSVPRASAGVAWLGEPPRQVAETFRCLDVRPSLGWPSEMAVEGEAAEVSALVAAGAVLLDQGQEAAVSRANLLPRAVMAQSERRRLVGWLALATAALPLAILLLVMAVRVSTWRHAAQLGRLQERIVRIRTESEQVRQQLQHLQAVAKALATHGTLPRVLSALLEASPESGLSYNQVEANAEGKVRLHGQAQSLALPFLLPERLEGAPHIRDVVLRDAGQVKKGAGSVTEFSLEFALEAEGAP